MWRTGRLAGRYASVYGDGLNMVTAAYDKYPHVQVDPDRKLCISGWHDIGQCLRAAAKAAATIVVECYPGVRTQQLEEALAAQIHPDCIIHPDEALRTSAEIENLIRPYLTDDPVFGLMNDLRLNDLFDSRRLNELRAQVSLGRQGVVLVMGTGSSLIVPEPDILVYADLARWEIQQRQRSGEIANLGAENHAERASLKYKRAFFVDWRVADKLKRELLDRIDFLLDTNDERDPKMIAGDDFRRGLELTASRPFRVVPFFDPGPWGGDWMMQQFNLPRDKPNYAWCFDCVPEENSLLLGFGDQRVEIPAIDVVFYRPKELLGESVYRRFGAEFPIRFDFLDTMNGGNLSLQVHPLTSYIREHFGLTYTQDESYYMLDAGNDASVFLGLKQGVDPHQMAADLETAQDGGKPFPAEQYVNRWPARRHDHFLIPGGTIHCSGRNSVVLEISATPFIFTFKLWDWGRLGLDGRPRPIHLEHGLANIQWDRTTDWVRNNLVNQIEPVSQDTGWREERTGLHSLEFIETRRHWFTGPTPHAGDGSVNVLNLVQGDEAVVRSPDNVFEPFPVHYAETFIVPAAAGSYVIEPLGGPTEHATVKASIRKEHAS
jgi:mannose-6-phosphate isomerase class I